jgi:hypothetical protein
MTILRIFSVSLLYLKKSFLILGDLKIFCGCISKGSIAQSGSKLQFLKGTLRILEHNYCSLLLAGKQINISKLALLSFCHGVDLELLVSVHFLITHSFGFLF